MNIALIAHEAKKELMVQFCIAYCGILSRHNLCIAIAAAIYYENEEDEFSRELTRIRKEEGIDAVLEKVCGLEADGTLGMLVKSKISLMKEWGWIHE